MKVSVVVPVYNEARTVLLLLERVLALGLDLEVVVVDDGSSDGTADLLSAVNDPRLRVLRHSVNQGKGAAVQTALRVVNGDIVVIQDADMEYEPDDCRRLVGAIERGEFSVVYGVRQFPAGTVLEKVHALGNRLISVVAGKILRVPIRDMQTCYKVFLRSAVTGLELRAKRFGFDPEITAFFASRGVKIGEVPVSYVPRSRREGKKIRLRDAVVVFSTLLVCRFRGPRPPDGDGRAERGTVGQREPPRISGSGREEAVGRHEEG